MAKNGLARRLNNIHYALWIACILYFGSESCTCLVSAV